MAPSCPDCGAEMQHIECMWRCPWTTTKRWRVVRLDAHPAVVTCQWPLDERREIEGLPNGVTE